MANTIYEGIDAHELPVLLNEIHEGKAVLPDFQRSFVWEPAAVAELITSMMQSFPAGSILRVRNTADTFRTRHFAGAPTNQPGKPIFLILDGQQRLTSLYQAFYGAGDHAFYIDLQALIDGSDIDTEVIISERRGSKRFLQAELPAYQAETIRMPLECLFGKKGNVDQWIRQVSLARHGQNMTAFLDMQGQLQDAEKEWLEPIRAFRFPVITLSDKTEPVAICNIFETLNRTGVKLTPFELLTARFYPGDNNLRDLWERAVGEDPSLLMFKVDPYVALQAITLRATDPSPTCKRSALMRLSDGDITQHWSSIVEGLKTGLGMLQDDCGVLNSRWLPYSSMLVPLAALLAKHPLGHSPDAGAKRAKLIRWFWCASLAQRYDRSANRKAEEDYKLLSSWLSGGETPEYISEFSFDALSLSKISPNQRARYAALMCLEQRRNHVISKHASLDFHTGKTITPELVADTGIDDHHIFPVGHLEKDRADVGAPANSILNRTLIDATTNRMIGKRPPSSYLGDIKAALAAANVEIGSLLDSHMIPSGDSAAIWRDDFAEFLKERQLSFERAIKSATLGAIENGQFEEDEAAE